MAEIIVLPKLGVNMIEASVLEWGAEVGEKINEGELLASVETDKAAQDMESPLTGTLLARLVETGKTIPCQTPIAIIGEPGEDISHLLKGGSPEAVDSSPPEQQPAGNTTPPALQPQVQPPAAPASQPQPPASVGAGRIRISPLAKKLAKQNKIDISNLSPAARGGRITSADVNRYMQGRGAAESAEQRIPLTGTRRTIASRMSLSGRNVPRAALTLSVDANEILKWKEAAKEDGLKIGITEIIVKALGKALRMYPMMNSRLADEEIVISRDVNVGVALDSEKGLLVPVIRSVTDKGVGEIASELRNLAAAGRAGSLSPEGMTGGTFTLSNLGMIGVEEFTPLVNHPECGILAVGAIKKEMVVNQDDESCSIRPIFRMTIVFDHRIIDGAPAGRFLADLKKLLEHPLSLLQ